MKCIQRNITATRNTSDVWADLSRPGAPTPTYANGAAPHAATTGPTRLNSTWERAGHAHSRLLSPMAAGSRLQRPLGSSGGSGGSGSSLAAGADRPPRAGGHRRRRKSPPAVARRRLSQHSSWARTGAAQPPWSQRGLGRGVTQVSRGAEGSGGAPLSRRLLREDLHLAAAGGRWRRPEDGGGGRRAARR